MRNLFYFHVARGRPSSQIRNGISYFLIPIYVFLFLVRVVYKITTLCVCVIYKNLNASGVDVGKSHTRIELKINSSFFPNSILNLMKR